METTKALIEQLRETNLNLNNIYIEQRNLIEKYVKERKKVFVTDEIITDEIGNYELGNINIEDIDYFYVEAEVTNCYGLDDIKFIKVIGLEYNEEYDEINLYYVDDDNESELLCGTFDCVMDTSYRNIVNMLIQY